MAFWKRMHSFRGMTVGAKFFSLFLLHVLESAVISIHGKLGRGLSRGIEQEKKNSATGEGEGDIQKQVICFVSW